MSVSSIRSAVALASLAESITLVESFLEFFQPRARSRPAPDRGLSASMRDVTDDILAASSREELLDRLDELSVSGSLFESTAKPVPTTGGSLKVGLSRVRKSIDDSELDLTSLTAILGSTATKQCENGIEAFKVLIGMVVSFIVAFGEALGYDLDADEKAAAPGEDRDARPRWEPIELLYEANLPVSFRTGIGKILRSIACAYAIARAEERGAKLEPWLALALAELFAEGFVHARSAALRVADDPASLATLAERSKGEREYIELLLNQWRAEAAGAAGTYYMSKLGNEAG